ncbi:MAG: hypothetical protein ACOY93_11575 [Bacillota bacterium]
MQTGAAAEVAHALTGLGVGLLFAVIVVTLAARSASTLSVAALLAQGLNELLFPVGCSVAIYTAEVLGRKVAAA